MVTIPGTSPYEDSYVIKFPDGDVSLERNISAISSDHIIHSVLEGETIQNIAFKYYGDSGMWGVLRMPMIFSILSKMFMRIWS